jgi:hypothetical protein
MLLLLLVDVLSQSLSTFPNFRGHFTGRGSNLLTDFTKKAKKMAYLGLNTGND